VRYRTALALHRQRDCEGTPTHSVLPDDQARLRVQQRIESDLPLLRHQRRFPEAGTPGALVIS
jgi:hypothetical protein